MNTRKWFTLLVGILILALTGYAGATFVSRAVAAPPAEVSAALLEQAPGAAMPPLPEAACTLAGTVRTCDLWALPGTLSMPDGASVPVWGFADSAAGPALVPGPVVRANQGETLSVVLHNQLPGEMVSLTFPGQAGLRSDVTGVASGATRTYTFVASTAGTFAYEAGPTANGARQVTMGLFGVLAVEGGAPSWNQELILVLNEVDPDFNANPRNFLLSGFEPQYWLLNGNAFPNTGWSETAAGTVLLVRYLNAGVEDRSVGMLGLSQQVIAMDGRSLTYPIGYGTVPLASGQTVDALVQVPATASEGTLYPLYDTSLIQHNNSQRLGDMRVAFGGMMMFLQVSGGAPLPTPTNTPVPPTPTDTPVPPAPTDTPVPPAPTDTPVPPTPTNTPVPGGDVTPPTLTNVVTVRLSATAFLLRGTATDTESNIAGAVWFVGTDPVGATLNPMTAADGGFNELSEIARAQINVTGWAPGSYQISMMAQDAAGNWSTVVTVVYQIN